jgi:hypothetical protein
MFAPMTTEQEGGGMRMRCEIHSTLLERSYFRRWEARRDDLLLPIGSELGELMQRIKRAGGPKSSTACVSASPG